ncbi:hypothetical protein BJV78DRAFT_1288728 [Lactifluus subvellereus]|nr:hypothetical protein BJV78DRAFT_1288728 [Lactifluus subvellereus]
MALYTMHKSLFAISTQHDLTNTSYPGPEPLYDYGLFVVINHKGQINNRHYTSVAHFQDTWCHFDDDKIKAGFNPPCIPSLGLTSPDNYSGMTLTVALTAINSATGHTIYVNNLPATVSVNKLLTSSTLAHSSRSTFSLRNHVFLSFLDGATAVAFHAEVTIKKLSLHGQEPKTRWGKLSPVPSQVMVALPISQNNVSHNGYLGGLDEGMTKKQLS